MQRSMFNLLRGIAQEASLTYQEADTRPEETIRGKRICNRGSSARKGKALVAVVTVKMERAARSSRAGYACGEPTFTDALNGSKAWISLHNATHLRVVDEQGRVIFDCGLRNLPRDFSTRFRLLPTARLHALRRNFPSKLT